MCGNEHSKRTESANSETVLAPQEEHRSEHGFEESEVSSILLRCRGPVSRSWRNRLPAYERIQAVVVLTGVYKLMRVPR